MASFILKKEFLTLKTGDTIESINQTDTFIQTEINGKPIMIPRAFVEESAAAKISAATREAAFKPSLGLTKENFEILKQSLSGTVSPDDPSITLVYSDTCEPVRPLKLIKLEENEIFLSSITGGVIPKSGIDHIITRYPVDHFPVDCREDIPKVDPDYKWNADLLEAMWISHKLNKKMLITGFPGTGKTTAVAQFGAWIRQPVMRFNGKDGIEASSFLGYPWATAGGMEWKDGMLPQGLKLGYLVTIDEVFKIPAGIQMAMQHLYEDDGRLVLDDKPGTMADKVVIPAESFRMFLTDNVKGTGDNFDKFSATQIQDSSTLDRFGISFTLNYMEDDDELSMLSRKYPKMSPETLKRMIKFANLIRNGYAKSEVSLTISPRGLQTICQICGEGLDTKSAIRIVYLSKIGDDDEMDAIYQMYETAFNEKINA